MPTQLFRRGGWLGPLMAISLAAGVARADDDSAQSPATKAVHNAKNAVENAAGEASDALDDDDTDAKTAMAHSRHRTRSRTRRSRKPPEPWIIEEHGEHARPQQLALSFGLAGFDGLGFNLFYAAPVAPDGLLPPLNDSFDVEFGIATGVHTLNKPFGSYYSVAPLIGVRWNFYLTPSWTVFAGLKLGWLFYTGSYLSEIAIVGGIGALWHFSEIVALRLGLEAYTGLTVGLSIDL